MRLLFAFALRFGVCFGVGYAFFSTRRSWFHAEAAAMWMWKHMGLPENSQATKRTDEQRTTNRPLPLRPHVTRETMK
jgi:hypothetical protein